MAGRPRHRARLARSNASVRFINLTPHQLNILTPDGERVFPASGLVARVVTAQHPGPVVGGIPTVLTCMGDVHGLPDPEPGVVFIVSGMVAALVSHRSDVFSPGPLVRDERGQPIGAAGLSRTVPSSCLREE